MWADAPPFFVLAEYRQADVRDTKRSYDQRTGQMCELPIDGTVNPAKVMQNLEWRRKGRLLTDRTARLLTAFHARYRELLANPLRLPEIPAGRRLHVVVARTGELRDALVRSGAGPRLGWAAEFRSDLDITYAYLSQNAEMQLDEFHCAGGRVQKNFDQDLCFAASAQLFHEYASTVQKRDPRSTETRQPVWLVAGLAHFMSGVECDAIHAETLDGAAITHNRLLLSWIASIQSAGTFETQPWTVQRMLTTRDIVDARKAARHLATAQHPYEHMSVLAAARMWAFAHFSWFARDGKRRGAFLDVARHVLNGTETPQTAAACYGLTSDADFAAIEADFDAYWRAILERQVGRDKVTKQWFEPETDPPAMK